MPKYKVDVQPAIAKEPLGKQPFRVAAYCRVSTDSDEQLGGLENQIKYYTNYILKQSSWTLAGTYSDNVSGVRSTRRNGYRQMMKDCKKERLI